MKRHLQVVAVCAAVLTAHTAAAQGIGGSAGCAEISQAAAAGLAGRIEADDQTIQAPESVSSMTCLDGFFNGLGLNVSMSDLDPQAMLTSVAQKALMGVCMAAKEAWNQWTGSIQCGLSLSSWNLGFGGLGGGTFCPRLSFGGGGPSIGSASLLSGANNGLYVDGRPAVPVGYPLTRPYGLRP